MNEKQNKIIKWSARVLSAAILLLGIPFYFGYGNPLPFIDPAYSWFDNLWLSIFPLMFIGLAIGWKYKRIGGFVSGIPVFIGLLATLIAGEGLIWHMLIPLFASVLYLVDGFL
jgi:hypothetical protein